MGYKERSILYSKIEELRGKPLIVYTTSSRLNGAAQMGQDMIPHFIKHLDTIDDSIEEIDLLIISSGGDPIVSWRVNSLLRNRFKKFTVLVPYLAYSAATLLALGADDIIMHRNGNLGPLDMQMTVPAKNQNELPMHFSYEDIVNYFKFIEDIGIRDQAMISDAFNKLTSQLSPIDLGNARRGSQLGLSMAEKLLSSHLSDSNKAKIISEKLNKQYYHHGYPVDKNEAKELGLEITDDPDIEQLMWSVTQDILSSYRETEPLDPQAYINDSIQKIGNDNIIIGNQYFEQVEIIRAMIESVRIFSYYDSTLVLSYQRMPDLSLQYNTNMINGFWKTKENPDEYFNF